MKIFRLPSPRLQRVAIVALSLCVGIPATGDIASASVAPTVAASGDDLAALEARVVELHNAARAERGLQALVVHDLFVTASREWSKELARTGEFRHATGSGGEEHYADATCKKTQGWIGCSENLAQGHDTPEAVHQAWMDSPGHAGNLLDPAANRIGVGVWRNSEGRMLWTVRFMQGTAVPTEPPPPHPLDGSTVADLAGTIDTVREVADSSVAAADEMTRYIDATFEVFAGRPATGAEQARWRSKLDGGLPRAEFIDDMSTSDVWLGNEIDLIYERALGRAPDASGRAYWTGVVRGGVRIIQLGVFVVSSDEYFVSKGNDAGRFAEGVYRAVLGRAATSSERTAVASRISAGVPRSAIVEDVYAGIESRRRRVDALYLSILGRTPGSRGRDYWAGVLLEQDDVRLAAFLAGSAEFYGRATA